MPYVHFDFVINELVYVKVGMRGDICPIPNYVPYKITGFYRTHNINYYQLANNQIYAENDLMNQSEYNASVVANQAARQLCVEETLDELPT